MLCTREFNSIVAPSAVTRCVNVSMSAPMPRIGAPKIGAPGVAFFAADFRARPAATNMLRSEVSAASCGTAAIENESVSAA